MLNAFNEKQIEFLKAVAQSRSSVRWIEIFEALSSYLNDSRNIQVPQSDDIEKEMGRALLQRRLAAKIIEEELIKVLKENKNPILPVSRSSTYR